MTKPKLHRETHRLLLEVRRMAERMEGAEREVAELTEQKNGAYRERNALVAALSKIFPSGLGRHVASDWEDDWRTIVFIDLPTGQASWHIHDSEAPMFRHLRKYEGEWDGHTTEEKYRRMFALSSRSPHAAEA